METVRLPGTIKSPCSAQAHILCNSGVPTQTGQMNPTKSHESYDRDEIERSLNQETLNWFTGDLSLSVGFGQNSQVWRSAAVWIQGGISVRAVVLRVSECRYITFRGGRKIWGVAFGSRESTRPRLHLRSKDQDYPLVSCSLLDILSHYARVCMSRSTISSAVLKARKRLQANFR
jgi:hypothetical protein